MKINFIITGIYQSGGMKVIFKYAEELSKRGHDIILYRRLIPYNYMRGISSINYIVGLYFNKLKNLFFRFNHSKNNLNYPFKIVSVPFINNFFLRNADVTIATEWVTAYSVDKLPKKKGVKVYFIQGYENWNSNTLLVNESYKLNLHRITVSNNLKNYLLQEFNVDSQVIMNGINYEEFYNDDERTAKNGLTISFIYYHQKNKNVNNALFVTNHLYKKYKNIKFLSFGFFNKTDLPSFVNYYENPNVETIRKIYCTSDIFIFPNSQEGFGLPPAEAMACKCAVVTTKVGGIPDYSTHLNTAIHVDLNDHLALLEGVEYLINNRSEIKRIANNAYIKIRTLLSWGKSVSDFEEYLNRLIEEQDCRKLS